MTFALLAEEVANCVQNTRRRKGLMTLLRVNYVEEKDLYQLSRSKESGYRPIT
jgi:hypothetical protein